MVFDVRAVVTTNLPGELISATISDSSIPGAGLIKTTGTAIMKSTVPVQGTAAVRFNINRPDENTKFAIPRPLYVISYAVDTLRGTIQYELGCKVTIKENTRKDITYSANDLVDRCFDIATVQITAGEVVAWACGQAGLLRVGDPPHANKFSIKEFDASAGFVDVIADLCFSEGLLFHQRTEDELVIESSINSAFEAKVIRIIDVTPTTSGEIPGSTVVANYSTLKLLDADPSEEDNLNWEKDETIGNPVTITIRYEEGDDTWESSFNYTPYQKTITEYDEWERVVKRTTTSNSIGAAVSPNYVQALVRRDFNNNSSQIGGSALAFGNAEFVTTTTTNITYVIPCNLVPLGDCNFNVVTPPEGYEEVESEETTVNEPYAALAGSVPGDYFDENDNLDTIPAGNIVTSITTTTYEQQYRNVRVNRGEDAEGNVQIKRLGAFPVTKTKTRYRKAYAYTSYGQAELAQRGRQGNSIGESLGFASRLCDDGVEMRVVTGREATVQIRPSYLDRIFNYYADQSQLDSNDNGFGTERRAQTIQGGVETGTAASGMIAINIPYSSDDKFDRIGLPPNIKYLSVAPAPTPESVASRVLRLQAKLIVGAKSGLSVQTFPEDLPEGHASFVAINGGIYLVNNRTYTLTAEGAVASFDGIAWLQAGGLPGRLFPMPSSVTELPPLTRLIGTISTIEDDAQAELDAAFPGAELNDAVRREDNGDYWVYDGSEWVFKGPSPGAIVVNKAPDQIIGTIATVGSTPQAALNAAFPSADLKDGVRALDTNSVWVYDGTTWIDEGQNPGEVLEVTPGSTADLFNVTIDNTFVVRSRVAVTKFEYGLNLLTEVLGPIIRSVVVARKATVVYPPVKNLAFAVFAPAVSSGSSSTISTTAFNITAETPLVSSGASISSAFVGLGINALLPAYVGEGGTVIALPETDIETNVYAPEIRTGVRVEPATATFAVAGLLPAVFRESPTFVGNGEVGAGSTFDSTAVWPTHQADDIGLLIIEASGTDATRTPPEGWAAVAGSPVVDVESSAGSKLQVWWKRAANSSEPSVSIPYEFGNHHIACIAVFRGCVTTGDPWDAVQTGAKTTASTTATVPSITTTSFYTRVVIIVGRPNDNASTTHFNSPANDTLIGLTEHFEAGSTQGNGGGYGVFSGVMPTQEATGTTTITKTVSTTDTYFVVALKGP